MYLYPGSSRGIDKNNEINIMRTKGIHVLYAVRLFTPKLPNEPSIPPKNVFFSVSSPKFLKFFWHFERF